MRTWNWTTAALAICSSSSVATAKAILASAHTLHRHTHLDDLAAKAVNIVSSRLEPRQNQPDPAQKPSTSGPIADLNNTFISTACTNALSKINAVSNEAGMTTCYNIISMDQRTATFRADLRIYQKSPQTGSFANIPLSDIMVNLAYPITTVFDVLSKRSLTQIKRQSLSSQTSIQQYSLFGSISSSLDLSLLDSTELLSLMIPSITFNSIDPSTNSSISTNLTSAEAVWFVAGEFSAQSNVIIDITNPDFANDAIAKASRFVLPGMSLDVTPIGSIITFLWVFVFMFVYGLGTIGRIRQRDIYRARRKMAASKGMDMSVL